MAAVDTSECCIPGTVHSPPLLPERQAAVRNTSLRHFHFCLYGKACVLSDSTNWPQPPNEGPWARRCRQDGRCSGRQLLLTRIPIQIRLPPASVQCSGLYSWLSVPSCPFKLGVKRYVLPTVKLSLAVCLSFFLAGLQHPHARSGFWLQAVL